MGSVAVPASRRAVQHEGEKHQEGSDAHPQNQPEPRASREKSKQLSLSFFALVNKLRTHMRTNTHVSLISDAISQNSISAVLGVVKVLILVNLRPFVELDLEC